MSLLDNAPFAADDPQARELLAALLTAYDQGPEVRAFVLAAGMRAAEFAWTGPMAEVWPRVLRRAADQGRLRRLVGVIAEDPNSAAYGIIARLAATPPITASAAPAPLSYGPGDVRRLVMDALDDDELSALCLDHFPAVYGQFAHGMSKSQKTLRLIEYCARRDRLPDLVRRVGEVNLVKVREFTDRLENRDEN
ncbi:MULTISPECIES: effector-associated domain EAD1-containing protein [Streptomyces]|uniref:Effector-associated domain EAD1-containing protein n=1 Tax=Streptomyces lonegramiae TaxID=3075524 RepID=A0ABU2XUW7_9ACTN|nr:effector-associated domain EAD1-containing protein [Streptomyces sp. DSM 41529]MDT0549691.1 effector-associated domain EAD1-containing protein [Streptomyces sp. DSM 41529]